MKALLLYIVSALLYSSLVLGKQVPVEMAKTVAENLYKARSGSQTATAVAKHTAFDSSGTIFYYIFEFKDRSGFVIVSAEDAGQPIVGYSLTENFGTPNPNLKLWLARREKEIRYLKANNIKQDKNIKSAWDRCLSTQQANAKSLPVNSGSVPPLLKTLWSQSQYYNDSCPDLSATGCVATAMAQIMKFWNYPANGSGSSSYCNCISQGYSNDFGNLSANYAATRYRWNNMPSYLTGPNADLAQLMYHCGVSVRMNYGIHGSLAYVIKADNYYSAENSYVTYFSYNPGTIRGLSRDNYSDTAWISMLKEDLDRGWPIQYAGFDGGSGHSWVCDGYDQNGFFHMNWGWGGSGNGYYSINALNPDGLNFNEGQECVLGIVPSDSSAVAVKENKILNENNFEISPNPSGENPLLKFKLNSAAKIKINVGDIYGNEVCDLTETEFSAGEQSINILHNTILSSGVYFIILQSNDEKITKKLIIN